MRRIVTQYAGWIDQDPVTSCTGVIRTCYVVLGFVLCVKGYGTAVILTTRAETDVVRRSSTTIKVFVSAPIGNQT